VRAVLDANILVSALLSRTGVPAQILARWLAGEFELVVSELLLAELERALAYPRLDARLEAGEAAAFVTLLREQALLVADPSAPAARSGDPNDDYLVALAEAARALLVSGDDHLLALATELPIRTARDFLDALDRPT
jgi:putative PIN family toxin of toxin-antitoxin system